MRFPSKQIKKKLLNLQLRCSSFVAQGMCLCVACDPVTSQDIYAFNTGMKQLNLKRLFRKRSKYTNKKGSSLTCLSVSCLEYRFHINITS